MAGEIKWISNIDKAIDIAKREDKNILAFIYANSCPYCKKMEKEIFEDKDGINYLSKKYIFLKLRVDKAQKIFLKTKVTPTIYIFTPNKELLASEIGYQNEEFFYWTVGKADKKLEELKSK